MLREYLQQRGEAAVAFSGGVDSAYLLYAASLWCKRVKAYYVKTPFQPAFELEDARRLAKELSVPLEILTPNLLQDERIAKNDNQRCYYCKQRIFTTIREAAVADGFSLLFDGSNADDSPAERPGMQALTELAVCSPLRECGLQKAEIRRLSREAGLFTHDKPAYACLATRIPTGEEITQEKLAQTERAEEFLIGLGFRDFRVRLWSDSARIQICEAQLPLLLEKQTELLAELKKDYSSVLLDLEWRK